MRADDAGLDSRLLRATGLVVGALLATLLLGACAKPVRPALIPDAYGSWPTTTNVRLDYPIPDHEDKYRVIHMNDVGFKFTRTGSKPDRLDFPVGTIIAKDIYTVSNPGPADAPVMVTAMVKAPTDPDSRGGWLWVVKDIGTGKESIMTGDFCVRCHSNANETHPYGAKNLNGDNCDYVFFVPGEGSVSTPPPY